MSNENNENNLRISDPSNWLELHGDTLYRYALKYVQEASIAEDLVQETILAAFKAREKFGGQSSEQTWFIGILKNKIMDHFRKSSREVNLEQSDIHNKENDDNFISQGAMKGTWQPSRRPAKWMVDSNDITEQNEFWEYLQKCLDGIDKKLSKVFILREIEEINYKEICNTLSISHTNLRVMLYRARKLLRICLENNWIEPK